MFKSFFYSLELDGRAHCATWWRIFRCFQSYGIPDKLPWTKGIANHTWILQSENWWCTLCFSRFSSPVSRPKIQILKLVYTCELLIYTYLFTTFYNTLTLCIDNIQQGHQHKTKQILTLKQIVGTTWPLQRTYSISISIFPVIILNRRAIFSRKIGQNLCVINGPGLTIFQSVIYRQ